VVTGEMIAPTLAPTRTEDDFVNHIQRTVAGDPEGEWIFIVGGLNIHWSAGLVEWIAQRSEPNRPLGKTRGSRACSPRSANLPTCLLDADSHEPSGHQKRVLLPTARGTDRSS